MTPPLGTVMLKFVLQKQKFLAVAGENWDVLKTTNKHYGKYISRYAHIFILFKINM